ncbi:hypothetical protein D3C86_1932670 [compost metagenome]
MLATSTQQEEAQALVGLHLIEGEDQLADHLGVEGVVLVGAVEPEGGETAGVCFQLDGAEVGHGGGLEMFAGSRWEGPGGDPL